VKREADMSVVEAPSTNGGSTAEKNVGGRPTRCSVALAEKVGGRVVKGENVTAACRAEGITPQRLSDWRKRTDEPYRGFTDTLDRLFAEAVGKAERNVYSGGKGWQASVRWLESMRRDRWQRSERREVKDDRAAKITIPFPDRLDRPGREAAKETMDLVDKMLSDSRGHEAAEENARIIDERLRTALVEAV